MAPNWAEATEGSPAVWARERYEWSDKRVVGTTQDSNVWQPGGTWTLTVQPRQGTGSHIRLVLDRRWKGKGWLFHVPVTLFGGQMFNRNLQKTLNVLASSHRRGERRPLRTGGGRGRPGDLAPGGTWGVR